MFSTPLLFSISMETNIEAREYGWTDSSDSNVSEDLFAKELESHLLSSEDDEVLFARHGPVVEPDLEDVALQRDFWNCCAIGFLLDYRKFLVHYMQYIVTNAWRIRGTISVVGRDSYFYIFHFEFLEDLMHICNEGPWAVNGALLVLERWRPNLVISNIHLNFISVWVQFHGLPLEYQYLELAKKMR